MSTMDAANGLYCRFCATKQNEDDIVLELKVYSYAYKEIEEKLMFFKADYVDLSNNLPLLICITCNAFLNAAYDFMINVKKSQSTLLEICNQNCVVKVETIETVLEKQENDDVKAESWSDEDSRSGDQKRETSSVTSKSNGTVQGLIDHTADKSWLRYPWSCRLCDSSFESLEVLREHSKEVHSTCFSIKCVDCDEIIDSFKGFVYHVRRHRPYLKQYCYYCNFKYEEGTADTDHISTHVIENQEVCERCGEILQTKNDFNSHVAKYDPPNGKYMPYMKRKHPPSTNDFSCDVCGKVMTTSYTLKKHREIHTDRMRNYTCEVCGNAFFTKGALTSHLFTHSDTKPEVCQICKKTFKIRSKLKQHVLTHSAIKPFKCEICFHCFKKKGQLTDHMLIHTNDMPFQCHYCGKAFKHRSYLNRHLNQHTGARPYVCSDCGMAFTNWANCNKHMKRKHGTSLAQNMVTPYGKVPINPKNGKPKKIKDLQNFKEWTEMILAPMKKGRKTKNLMEQVGVIVSQD